MKGFAIVLMIIVSVYCQDLLTPSKHTKYADNVQVNLKTYGAENKRIRTDLNTQIRRKKALVVEGNAYNAQLKKVTGFVNTWDKDIQKTKVDTKNFEKSAKKTRVEWAGVKKTQEPPKGVAIKVKAKAGKAAKGKATKVKAMRRLQSAKGKAVKGKAAKGKATKVKAAKGKAAKGKAAKGKATKGKAVKGKAIKVKAAKGKAAKAKPAKKVSGKTLESVNAQYRAQVTELEKNVNHVIKQIKIVYANAEKDDKDAAKLQLKENKTLQELKTFLKHLMEYIKWTRTTMKNYHILFHSRPDNVFAIKTTKLINKIRAVL